MFEYSSTGNDYQICWSSVKQLSEVGGVRWIKSGTAASNLTNGISLSSLRIIKLEGVLFHRY